MGGRWSMLAAAAITGLGAGVCAGPGPARAFDCARARLPVERAICADPAAKAADEAMEAAFAAVREALSGEGRRAALDDQRDWLKARNARCAEDKADMGGCLARADAERARALTGVAEAGPGLPRAPAPLFVRQAGAPGRTEVGVRLYRFADPASPGERALNAQADKAVAAIPFKADDADDVSPGNWSHDETWTIAYASPQLVSIRHEGYDFTGGAHGSSGIGGLTFDWPAGRVLAFPDLFDKPAAADIGRACLVQIKAARRERGADAEPDAALSAKIAPVVSDLANWVFTGPGASVAFDAYAIGSYAEGAYTCDLPLALVARLAKRPVR